MKKLAIMPLVILTALVLACGGGGDDDDGGSRPSVTDTGATLEVTIVDFGFEPVELSVKSGVESTIEVTNGGNFPHTFTVQNVVDSGRLDGGATSSVSFTIQEPGEYQFFCTVHGAATMSGKLIVE